MAGDGEFGGSGGDDNVIGAADEEGDVAFVHHTADAGDNDLRYGVGHGDGHSAVKAGEARGGDGRHLVGSELEVAQLRMGGDRYGQHHRCSSCKGRQVFEKCCHLRNFLISSALFHTIPCRFVPLPEARFAAACHSVMADACGILLIISLLCKHNKSPH